MLSKLVVAVIQAILIDNKESKALFKASGVALDDYLQQTLAREEQKIAKQVLLRQLKLIESFNMSWVKLAEKSQNLIKTLQELEKQNHQQGNIVGPVDADEAQLFKPTLPPPPSPKTASLPPGSLSLSITGESEDEDDRPVSYKTSQERVSQDRIRLTDHSIGGSHVSTSESSSHRCKRIKKVEEVAAQTINRPVEEKSSYYINIGGAPFSMYCNPKLNHKPHWFTHKMHFLKELGSYIKRKKMGGCMETHRAVTKNKLFYAKVLINAANEISDKTHSLILTNSEFVDDIDREDFRRSALYKICIKYKVWGDEDPLEKKAEEKKAGKASSP